MALFQKLFKRQPGGSVVGNILRGVGDKFTGGLYSQVFKAPTKADGTASAAAINVDNALNTLARSKNEIVAGDTVKPTGAAHAKPGLMDWLKEKWYYVGAAVVSLWAVWHFMGGKKSKKKYW